MKFKDDLIKEGFTNERATSVYYAMETLHCALSKLDQRNLDQFFTVPVETRLTNFAEAEGFRILTSSK